MKSNITTQTQADEAIQLKLIAVGDTGVGKSCILTRFVYDKFNEFSQATLGAAFMTKHFTMIGSGKLIQFHIWDTAGQEKYKSIAPIYYREAKIALCVYDICSKNSYEVLKKWVTELKDNGPSDIVLAIVGNKIDRYEDQQVDYGQVKEYAASIGAIYKLVSAKEGKNVKDLFNTVAQTVLDKMSSIKKGDMKLKDKQKQKKKCC